MKKKRYYRTGAVFEIGHTAYILSQTRTSEYNLISLQSGSNRWTKPVKANAGWTKQHEYHVISDRVIRKLVGPDQDHSSKTKKYSYLGQFNEVFERMGL